MQEPNILGVRMETRSKFYIEDRRLLDINGQNVVARDLYTPGDININPSRTNKRHTRRMSIPHGL